MQAGYESVAGKLFQDVGRGPEALKPSTQWREQDDRNAMVPRGSRRLAPLRNKQLRFESKASGFDLMHTKMVIVQHGKYSA